MKIRTKLLSAGVFAALLAGLFVATAVKSDTGTAAWKLHLNETRGPIRAADTSAPSGKEAMSEILGGPTSGSDNAYLIFTRMAPGARGPAMFTLSVEDYYIVTSGKLNVQIGTDKFVLDKYEAALIPANIPHEVWNDGAEPEMNLEVITCGNPSKDLSRNLMSMVKPAQATKVDDAAQYIRRVKVLAPSELETGLNRQNYTSRSKGSPVTIALDSTPPGSGGPRPHVHRFEQVYFEMEGETTVMYGIDSPILKKDEVVILPAGVVHTNTNQSSGVERHITFLLPEPASRPYDVEFEEKGAITSSTGTTGVGPAH